MSGSTPDRQPFGPGAPSWGSRFLQQPKQHIQPANFLNGSLSFADVVKKAAANTPNNQGAFESPDHTPRARPQRGQLHHVMASVHTSSHQKSQVSTPNPTMRPASIQSFRSSNIQSPPPILSRLSPQPSTLPAAPASQLADQPQSGNNGTVGAPTRWISPPETCMVEPAPGYAPLTRPGNGVGGAALHFPGNTGVSLANATYIGPMAPAAQSHSLLAPYSFWNTTIPNRFDEARGAVTAGDYGRDLARFSTPPNGSSPFNGQSSPLANDNSILSSASTQVMTPMTVVSAATPYQRADVGNQRFRNFSLFSPTPAPLRMHGLNPHVPSPLGRHQNNAGGTSENLESRFRGLQVQENPGSNIFRPMETCLNLRPTTQAQAYLNMLNGFSPNYKGNINLSRNRSANIPADKNCSLFLLGLNPEVTTRELLSSIRNVGRIYATHINKPEPHKCHMTCAAKVTFFERAAAERFYNMYHDSGFMVHGHPEVASVLWNRIRSAESPEKPHRTRVLQIAGPPDLVNPQALTAYFDSKLEYQIDEILVHGTSVERNVVEFRFGSYRCQAEAAKMALGREYPDGDVRTWHGPDPCDLVDESGQVISRY